MPKVNKTIYIAEKYNDIWDHVREKSKSEKISIGYLLLSAYAKLWGVNIKKYHGRKRVK